MAEPEEQRETFQSQGFLKMHLLSPATCHQLRKYVIQDLEAAWKLPVEDSQHSRFSAIRKRQNRWDLKLNSVPIVRAAMKEILECNDFLKQVLPEACRCLAEDLVLAELGSLISDPGAPAQDWHADSLYQNDTDILACCFIALQETPLTMGPTEIIPFTHTHDFHKTALGNFPPKGIMPSYVSPKSMVPGYVHAGEACLMDCRLYHRGGANTHHQIPNQSTQEDKDETKSNNDGRRLIFYFTARSRSIPPPGGFLFTIVEELDGMLLEDFLV